MPQKTAAMQRRGTDIAAIQLECSCKRHDCIPSVRPVARPEADVKNINDEEHRQAEKHRSVESGGTASPPRTMTNGVPASISAAANNSSPS